MLICKFSRNEPQSKINDWHLENKRIDQKKYKSFLKDIGYIFSDPGEFDIDVEEVDDEISQVSGPQLVGWKSFSPNPGGSSKINLCSISIRCHGCSNSVIS